MSIYDVVIVGGGVAGCSAALSAAKENLKVCLIEKLSLLGGLATSGLINWYEPLCDGNGKQLIFGQAEDFFNLALKYGYSTYDSNWSINGKRKSSWFNHNLFALSLNRLMIENDIHIEYESLVTDVIIENKTIKGIVLENIEGKKVIYAKIFIDASGSAILFRKSNIDVIVGENYLTYATTNYLNKGIGKPIFKYSGANAYGKGHPENLKYFNGLKQSDINEYLTLAQNLALDDFENQRINDISSLPSMPQFRKIAAICGQYTLSNKDKNKYNVDSIGVIGAFYKSGEYFEIPLGCLYNNKINNLFAAGRIISANEDAWEAIRTIPVGIFTGEICGILAKSYLTNSFKLDLIQEKIINRDIKLHY